MQMLWSYTSLLVTQISALCWKEIVFLFCSFTFTLSSMIVWQKVLFVCRICRHFPRTIKKILKCSFWIHVCAVMLANLSGSLQMCNQMNAWGISFYVFRNWQMLNQISVCITEQPSLSPFYIQFVIWQICVDARLHFLMALAFIIEPSFTLNWGMTIKTGLSMPFPSQIVKSLLAAICGNWRPF